MEVRKVKIIRPNIRLSLRLGGLAKAHSAMNGISTAEYVGNLVYDDLKKRYPQWMEDVPREEAYLPLNTKK